MFPSAEPLRARIIGRTTVVELTEADQAILKTIIRERGVTGAMRLLNIARGPLTTAAAGCGVRRGTALLIQNALRALGR